METKRKAYAKLILKLLLAGSAVYLVALLNPTRTRKAVKGFERFTAREMVRLRQTLRRLEKQRLLRIIERAGETEIRLTPSGERRARRAQLEELAVPRPSSWDKKWRMVIFDIPEYLHVGRDVLRQTLQRLGFYQAQKSVFLHPYPCEREIEALAEHLGFEKYIHYFHVEIPKLSYHKHLAKHFKIAD